MRRLTHDQNGGVFVEAAIIVPMILILVMGAVDFLFAFYQWNIAAKAVEVGARIAAVSNPVATNLSDLSTDPSLGTPFTSYSNPFAVTCDGSTSTCSCSGTCTGWTAGYDPIAMNRIVFGRDGNNSCGDSTDYYYTGMCDVFWRIGSANVVVTYTNTGLTFFVGRSMPVPTI